MMIINHNIVADNDSLGIADMVYYNKQYNVYCELCKTVTKNPPIYLSLCFSLYFSKLDSSSVKNAKV